MPAVLSLSNCVRRVGLFREVFGESGDMLRHLGIDRFRACFKRLRDVTIAVAQDARDFERPRRQCLVQRSGAAVERVVDTAEQPSSELATCCTLAAGPIIERLRVQRKDFRRAVGMLGELAIEVAALAVEHALQRLEMRC